MTDHAFPWEGLNDVQVYCILTIVSCAWLYSVLTNRRQKIKSCPEMVLSGKKKVEGTGRHCEQSEATRESLC